MGAEKQFCEAIDANGHAPKCNWKEYSNSLGLEVGLSNYDEGFRCFVRIVRFDGREWANPKCANINLSESPFR